MTNKEGAALKRENDELENEKLQLEEKRKKLKLSAEQHRDDLEALKKDGAEVDKLNGRQDEIEKRLGEIKKELENNSQKNENLGETKRIMETIKNYRNYEENMQARDAVATPEYRTGWLKKISGRVNEMTDLEKRVMTTVNNDAVVPLITLDTIMGRLTAEGVLRSAVQIFNIPNLIEIPIEDLVNDAEWLAEGTAGTVKTDTTKSIKLSHNKLVRFIQITVELQTLSLNALESWIVDRMVKKMSIGLEKAVALGTGLGQPTGFITGITWDATNSKEVTTLTYDDLVKVRGLLDEEYYADSYYIMNRASLEHVRLLKDENKRPLFIDEVKDGFVGRISGIPVQLSRHVDGIYIGSWKNVWAGNFIKSVEFTNSAEAGFMSVSTIYRAYALFDGKPIGIPGTIARIKIA